MKAMSQEHVDLDDQRNKEERPVCHYTEFMKVISELDHKPGDQKTGPFVEEQLDLPFLSDYLSISQVT